jgi:hypothetical protein
MPEPEPGQRLMDEQGVNWLVQSVTRSDALQGLYIVRLAFGIDTRCEQGVWVLGRREYEALWRERRLVVASAPPPQV